MEKHWITQKWYFRIYSTLIAMTVVDAYLLREYSMAKAAGTERGKEERLSHFVDVLCMSMISKAREMEPISKPSPSQGQRVKPAAVYHHHELVSFGRKESGIKRKHDGKPATVARQFSCKWCAEKRVPKKTDQATTFFCAKCLIPICNASTGRDCFEKHILLGRPQGLPSNEAMARMLVVLEEIAV